VIGIHPIGVEDNLFDLGMDSLLYFSLLLEIESRFDRKLPDDVFVKAPTIESLTRLLTENSLAPDSLPTLKNATVHSAPIILTAGRQYSRKPKLYLESLFLFRYVTATVIGALIPFSVATGFLAWICSRHWAQAVLAARKKVRLIRRSLSLIDGPMEESTILKSSLMCNLFNPWLLGTLPRITPEQFNSLVTVNGLAHFETSYRKGHGIVLLVSHYGIPHLDLFLLNRMGFQDIATQAIVHHELKLMHLMETVHIEIKAEPLKNFVTRSVALYTSRDVLLRGGVVRMAADGLHGTNGINVPFHGRMRLFRSGFAELAVSTGADVIPVFTTIDITGRFKVDFLAPLHYERRNRNRQSKMNALIKKYAHLLEKRWAEEPGNIEWCMLEHYMTLPPASLEDTP
jgi:lauroyl/myristoyl acyltransferase